MRKHREDRLINRRQLLQAAAAAGLLFSFPGTASSLSLPKDCQYGDDDGRALILTNCNLIDVAAGRMLPNKVIIVRRGLIEAVADRAPEAREGQRIYDLKNRYVIPGLIDAHCHMTLSSESAFNVFGIPTTYSQIKRNFIQQLTHGVTTVRDMGAMPKVLASVLKMVERNELTGPRVLYCNAFTNIYGGHPDVDPAEMSVFSGLAMELLGNPSLWFKDTEELIKLMAQNSAFGASFIKLTLDNKSLICGRGNIPVYADEHLRAIIEFAGRRNMPTAGHIHTKFGFDRALQYGIASIEHMIGDARLSDRDVTTMAKRKIAIVPTLIIAQMLAAEEAYVQLPPEYRTDFIGNEMAERRRYLESCGVCDVEPAIHRANMSSLKDFSKYGCENLSARKKFAPRPDLYFNILRHGPANLLMMKQAGVLIGCGTDSGVPFMYHGTLWREMEMLGRIGFSNEDILRCATINNARILRMADKIGSIEKGKAADMVVLADNPLKKITACRTSVGVIKAGCIYGMAKDG